MRPLKEVLKEIEKIDAEYDKAFQLPTISLLCINYRLITTSYVTIKEKWFDCNISKNREVYVIIVVVT